MVAKLFNIITPRRAYFGMKDYQQLVIIEKMTRDLDMDIEIIRCPTVRESDGLAMSSRNAYLDEAGRKNAVWLSRVIRSAAGAIIEKSGFDGGLELSRIESDCVARLIEKGFSSVDYFKIADAQTLKEFTDPASFYASDKIFIASAAYMGKTRLIDNIVFDKPRSASNVK